MRFLIQVVKEASVEIEGKVYSSIGPGYLVLIGVGQGDTPAIADRMVKKLLGLRINKDENGKTNKNLESVQGELLLVSQFTLYADTRHGNRPGFTDGASPELASKLYEYVIEKCREAVPKVETGIFGAEMAVRLVNDGPFTILLDSKELGFS